MGLESKGKSPGSSGHRLRRELVIRRIEKSKLDREQHTPALADRDIALVLTDRNRGKEDSCDGNHRRMNHTCSERAQERKKEWQGTDIYLSTLTNVPVEKLEVLS